ncbi:hypothetical protein E5720_18700 [Rhodococcus sp. PAMC28707]|uniref:hypothetical protein n=1 Tax=unclassified Rhodococcus (in: high G+C Gram-positive bacteria) TaxID=192944 RepID=UPI00109E1E09|nr:MULTISPECIES: hypothetical protein [unclassified Rhodococcus (in: high G+C Gram-positive bacteria)]QCB51631.1 hypothetical protein E5769_16825 [Rhodococcus sp. PAMC28705]QCB60202.1 hypothetical protein E5720_18700 [Rhodococcus sp. PAMC28707]
MDSSGSEQPLSATERGELDRLRRELAELREELTPAAVTRTRAGHSTARWIAAILLLVLVAVLGFSAVLARFTRSEVLDADRYVETVTPLGSNPVLQGELADQITNEIMTRLDVESITAEALTSITENAPRVPPAVVGLAPVIADQAESFVHKTVESLVSSDEFETLWIKANREAHQALTAVLTGNTRAAVGVSDEGTVSISLAPIIDKVRAKLTERGFAFAEKIPSIDKSFVLFQAPDLVKAQRVTSLLDKASGVLPWLTLLAAVGAVWVSPKGMRRRAGALVGVSLAVAMALLAVAISIGRLLYLDAVPADVLSPQAATVLIDTLLVPLETTLRAVFVLAVVIAIVGYLTGSSGSAVAVRSAYGKGTDAIRGRAGGRAPNRFESVVSQLRLPLRAGIVAIAVMTLVLWKYPSGAVAAVTVVVAVAALLVVELIARPALGEVSPEDGRPT